MIVLYKNAENSCHQETFLIITGLWSRFDLDKRHDRDTIEHFDFNNNTGENTITSNIYQELSKLNEFSVKIFDKALLINNIKQKKFNYYEPEYDQRRLVGRIQYYIFTLILFLKLKLQCWDFASFCSSKMFVH